MTISHKPEYNICILKGNKRNMDNLLLYTLVGMFMYALVMTVVPILWAESPVMFVLSIVIGCVLSYANGDWD